MTDYPPKAPVSYEKLKYRINPVRKPAVRFPTRIPTLDQWLGGGLPYGLTIFYGAPGAGKSMFAREIAKKADYALYFACEVLSDAPDHSKFPNVDTVDYTRYLPNYQHALKEMDAIISELSPDFVVIDSLTSFLSSTRKALPESDLRDGVAQIHQKYEGDVPIVGVSEIRGTGFSESTAGGIGVKHGCSALCYFGHVFAEFNATAESYGIDLGDDIYTFNVEKDKHGVSKHERARVSLTDTGDIIMSEIKRRARGEKGYEKKRNPNSSVWDPQ